VAVDAELHAWTIEEREYVRHETRRGKRHAYDRLDPTRTALVVIDMVPFYEASAYVRGIVPNVNATAASVRSRGGTVAWVVPADEVPGEAPDPHAVEFFGAEVAALYRGSGGNGPLHERMIAGLDVSAGDRVVQKRAYSAFLPGYCTLPDQLRDRDIDTVLITGTVANVCCESSARDASMTGFRVIMVADGNAAQRDRDLNATLHTFYRSFGDVRPTAEVVGLIDAG
jgi:nicotinamidase-related amidase